MNKQLVYLIIETQENCEEGFIVRDIFKNKKDANIEKTRLENQSNKVGSEFTIFEREVK
jgi:hypothetical protein